MTIKINILENGAGIEILASGTVYGREIIEAHDDMYGKNIVGQKYHLIDKSQCTEYNVSADEIKIIAGFDKVAAKTNPNIIIAIVESETLQFSLTDLWQSHIDGDVFKTKSFSDRASADIWIVENQG